MKHFEKFLKKIFLNLLSPLLKTKPESLNKSNWKNFKRILVFRLDNRLGNAILILPLVQSIKKSNPVLKIDVMMSSDYCQIYNDHPDINEVIRYDQSHLMKNPIRYLSLIKYLRKNQYDVVFSSSNANAFSVSQAIFAGLMGGKHSVGFDWLESGKLYTDVIKGNTDIQYGDAQVDLWRHFDSRAVVDTPKIYFSSNTIPRSQNKKVLFWLGATGNKILPEKMITNILLLLEEKNISYQLAAGPADENLFQNYPLEWKDKTLFLKGSLRDTSEFFCQYSVVLIPDTGPMHLAVALGIPTVQVFVNSDPTWYAYTGENNFVINKVINKKELKKYFIKFVN